jgi:hypothetical protein
MDIITTKKGLPISVHLHDAVLIASLVSTGFTVVCYSSTASKTTTSISFATAELGTYHYLASAVFADPGQYYLSIVYSTFSVEYQINVVTEDLSFVSSKLSGEEGDYIFTVVDSNSAVLSGATVRLFDSGGTTMLTKATSDSEGKVYFALPVGTYKARVSKSGYDFSSSNPYTLTVKASAYLAPVVSEFLPTSPSSSGTLCITGRNFISGTKVYINSALTTPASIASAGNALAVTLPAGLGTTVLIKVSNPDPDNVGSYLSSIQYTLGVT